MISEEYSKDGALQSIHTMTEEVAIKVTESLEEFIFETISPFCNETTKRKVSKHDLTQALMLYYGLVDSKKMTNREKFKEIFGFDHSIIECPFPTSICKKTNFQCSECCFFGWWEKEYKPCFKLREGLNE